MIQFRTAELTVFQSSLYQTTSTVLQTPDLVLVVDPTWLPSEVAEIQQHVTQILQGRPLYLLFTHGDWDHILAYRAFPGAVTIGSRQMAELPVETKEKTLEQIRRFDCKNYIKRNDPVEFPNLDLQMTNGDVLQVGGTTLTFYEAPGHTQEGLFTVIEPHGIFLAGDYLSDVEFPFISDRVSAYETTLAKATQILSSHEIQLLIPGHGSTTSSLVEMKKRIQESASYLQIVREAVLQNSESLQSDFLERYEFYQELLPIHLENIEVLKKELAGGNR